MTENYSLYNALNDYGFLSEEQKNALEKIMQRASILTSNQSIENKFTVKDNYDDFAKDLLDFVKITQAYWCIKDSNATN